MERREKMEFELNSNDLEKNSSSQSATSPLNAVDESSPSPTPSSAVDVKEPFGSTNTDCNDARRILGYHIALFFLILPDTSSERANKKSIVNAYLMANYRRTRAFSPNSAMHSYARRQKKEL